MHQSIRPALSRKRAVVSLPFSALRARWARTVTRTGFTLIEVMVCIAIIAIIEAAPVPARNGIHFLAVQTGYRNALHDARSSIDALRATPLGTLPPQVLTVPPSGVIRLGASFLVPNSVRVFTVAGRPLPPPTRVNDTTGVIAVSAPPGKRIVLDYAFYQPDRGEAHTLPQDHSFRLANAPVTAITAVHAAHGASLQLLPASAYTLRGSQLRLPQVRPGTVIRVDYLGCQTRSRISGCFLNAAFHPCAQATTLKELHVEEIYGDKVGRIRLDLVKVAP